MAAGPSRGSGINEERPGRRALPAWFSATPLTRRRQDRFHRAFSRDQDHWLGADRWNRDPRTAPRAANRRIGARRAQAHGRGSTHNLPRAHLAVAVLAGLLTTRCLAAGWCG